MRPRPRADIVLADIELDILALLAQGNNNGVIAAKMFMSEEGVKAHVKNMTLKIGLSCRRDLFVWAKAKGKDSTSRFPGIHDPEQSGVCIIRFLWTKGGQ